MVVLDDERDRRIDVHVGEWHRLIPGSRTDQLAAVPWPDGQIPDEQLAKMVEQLETTGADLPAVVGNFGYPPSLAERELARYKSLSRFVLSLAAH